MCELYVHGDAAQVESVETLEEFRNRGAASAVVLAAVRAAREAGVNWIHLYADANDWPQVTVGVVNTDSAEVLTGLNEGDTIIMQLQGTANTNSNQRIPGMGGGIMGGGGNYPQGGGANFRQQGRQGQ
jgi:predicted GNAT family acetyltransferase